MRILGVFWFAAILICSGCDRSERVRLSGFEEPARSMPEVLQLAREEVERRGYNWERFRSSICYILDLAEWHVSFDPLESSEADGGIDFGDHFTVVIDDKGPDVRILGGR